MCASGGCWASKSCLGDFVGSSTCSCRSRLLVRCVLDCLSRACPLWHPTAFLNTRPFYRGDSGHCRDSDQSLSLFPSVSIFWLVCPSLRLSPPCLSLSLLTLLQREPRIPVSANPIRTASTHDSIRTARIFISVDSFIGNDS